MFFEADKVESRFIAAQQVVEVERSEPERMLLESTLNVLKAAFETGLINDLALSYELSETLRFWVSANSLGMVKYVKFDKITRSRSYDEYQYIFKKGERDQLRLHLMLSVNPMEFSKLVIVREKDEEKDITEQKVTIYFADKDYGQTTSEFFPLEAFNLTAYYSGVIEIDGKLAYLYYTPIS